MAAPLEKSCGYAQLDDKGRLPLAKEVRNALGIGAGSTLAYVRIGEALMVIPQDAHLARVLEAALRVLEQAHINADDIAAELQQARAEVVTEHYGGDVLDALEQPTAASPRT